MKLKQPHHISFDNFEDILKNHVDSSSQPPYTGRTFAMVKNVIPALKKSGFANNLLQFSDIRLGCIKEGEIEGIINLRHYHLTKGNIVCLTPNTILELTKVSPNFNLMGLTLNSEQLAIWHKESLPTFLINQMSEIVLKPNSEDLEIFFQLFNLLWNTAHRYGDDCKMVPDLMSCIFHHVQYIISTYSKDNNRTEKREKKIFQTFILLVNLSLIHILPNANAKTIYNSETAKMVMTLPSMGTARINFEMSKILMRIKMESTKYGTVLAIIIYKGLTGDTKSTSIVPLSFSRTILTEVIIAHINIKSIPMIPGTKL